METKPVSKYSMLSESKKEELRVRGRLHYAKHREKIRERARARYKRTDGHLSSEKAYKARYPDRVREIHRRYSLEKKFGMSLEDYERMAKAQEGRCAICGKTPPERGIVVLYVDHDHVTGKTRKLLCRTCNAILGFCSDDKEILRRALAYLEAEG